MLLIDKSSWSDVIPEYRDLSKYPVAFEVMSHVDAIVVEYDYIDYDHDYETVRDFPVDVYLTQLWNIYYTHGIYY